MLEDWMANLCKDLDNEGNPAYPDITLPNDLDALTDGTTVFITTAVTIEGEEVLYSFPGQLQTVEGVQSVEFFQTNIWARIQSPPIVRVNTGEAEFMRLVWVTDLSDLDPDHSVIMEEVCGSATKSKEFFTKIVEKLYNDDADFAAAMKKTKDKFQGVLVSEYPRCVFLTRVIGMMGKDLSIKDWQAQRPADPDALDADHVFVKQLKKDYFTPVLNELSSGCADSDLVTAFKAAMGQGPSNSKYVYCLMDLAAEHCHREESNVVSDNAMLVLSAVPGAPQVPARGGRGVEREIVAIRKKLVTQAANTQAMAEMLNRVATQLHLRQEAKVDVPVYWTASQINVKGDHSCGYNTLQALADKAANPDAVLSMNKAQADKAKVAVMWQAKQLHDADPEKFKNETGFDLQEYMTR